MPFAGYENFEACVLDQIKKGHSEESARKICGKLQAEAEMAETVTKKEADGEHPASHYLVVEDPEQPSTWHLRVKDASGKLDHGLMGAAWAALHEGYRGSRYEGPQKQAAIAKLRAFYAEEKMPVPGSEHSELDGQWIEVFRAGDYGDKGQYSRENLDQIAANYDPQIHEAPIVVGHPELDSPAYGWVEALRVSGNGAPKLEAKLRQVDEGFAALVKEGRFKNRSVALYSDLAGKGLYLRHLGFLGAQPPEVKGLKSVFHDAEAKGFIEVETRNSKFENRKEEAMEIGDIKKAFGEVLESLGLKKREPDPTGAATVRTFSEAEVKAAAEKAAADAKAEAEKEFAEKQKAAEAIALRKTQIREFVERLKPLGKWIPAFEKLGLVEFMEALPTEQTIEFGEAGKKEKKSAVEIFQKFLEGLPKIVELGERPAPGDAGAAPAPVAFNETPGIALDAHSAMLAARAQEIATRDKVDYGVALRRAREQFPARRA